MLRDPKCTTEERWLISPPLPRCAKTDKLELPASMLIVDTAAFINHEIAKISTPSI